MIFPRDHIEGATPVPIPNTVVKPLGADGTALATVWESRTLRGINMMDGIESYSNWIRRYDDWVALEARSRTLPIRWVKGKEKVFFEEGSSYGPSPKRVVYESPFYKDYQRYISAAKGRQFVREVETLPAFSTLRLKEPKFEEPPRVHHEFWRAFDAIAREVIRREGYGGFIYKPQAEDGIILRDEDSQERIRSKIDTLISDWLYWGLTMEEAKEVTKKAKEILTNYLYDRIKGNDLSPYSDYGEDLVTYLPQIERTTSQIEEESEEIKEEGRECKGL